MSLTRSWTSNSYTTLNRSSVWPMTISQGLLSLKTHQYMLMQLTSLSWHHPSLNRAGRHRALNLVNLSTSLSGVYSCRSTPSTLYSPSCFLIFNSFRVSSNHGDSFKSKSLTIFCKLIGISRMTLYKEFEVLVAPFISTNMISSVLNKCTNLGFESYSGEMQNYWEQKLKLLTPKLELWFISLTCKSTRAA